jgi:TonB family protein
MRPALLPLFFAACAAEPPPAAPTPPSPVVVEAPAAAPAAAPAEALLSRPLPAIGWRVAVEDGEVNNAELAALHTVLRPCPPSTQEWGARVSEGALRRLGAIVADEGVPDEGVESCLRAGLEAKPPTGAAMLRLHHVDPELDAWRAQLQGLLNRVVGPQRGATCVMVSFRLGKDGAPSGPKLTRSSGDPALDDAVMRAVLAWKEPLPAPSKAARQRIEDSEVTLCVTGTTAR